jgi:hypothetical protein
MKSMKIHTVTSLIIVALGLSACGLSEGELAGTSEAETAAVPTPLPPTSTPLTTSPPTQTSTPTAILLPSSFSDYHSAERSVRGGIILPYFSVRYPTDWVIGGVQDDGITVYSFMSDPKASKSPSGVWLMIMPGGSSEGFSAWTDYFTSGAIIEGPDETIVNGHKYIQAVLSDGEILQITAFKEGDDPPEGVFVVAYMPLSGEDMYRPLMEQIIDSIEVYSNIPNAIITADPHSGSIPTTYIFTLSDFQPSETVYIAIYYEPPPRPLNNLLEVTLTVDENGVGEFSFTSKESNPKGEYLIVAVGNEGSYAEVLVVFE